MKKIFLVFLLILILSAALHSQEEARKITVGLGGEIGGGVFLVIPEVAGYITVPINFSDIVTLTPKVGFSYLFTVMEETHTNYLIPLGVDILFNKYHFGFSVKYLLAVEALADETNPGEHWLAATLTGYVPFIQTDDINFFLQFDFGPAFLIRPGSSLRVFTHIHPALGFQYFF
jgi:hypothetical protein